MWSSQMPDEFRNPRLGFCEFDDSTCKNRFFRHFVLVWISRRKGKIKDWRTTPPLAKGGQLYQPQRFVKWMAGIQLCEEITWKTCLYLFLKAVIIRVSEILHIQPVDVSRRLLLLHGGSGRRFFLLRYVKCFASGSISKHTGEQRDYICGGCCFCTCLITMSVLYLCVEWTVHYWIRNDPSHCVSTVPPSPYDAPYLLEPFNDFYVHFKKCPNSSCWL